MRFDDRGFTLVEALVALAVLSILLGIAVPTFDHLAVVSRKNSAVQQARALIMLARSTAVIRHKSTTVCISDDGQACSKYGSRFLLVFIDMDGDHQASDGEIIRQEPLVASTRYTLTASTLASFRFRANGSALSYGNLVVCPSTESRNAASLVISRMGRLRAGLDRNDDGVVEGTDGAPLDCSA